MTISVPPQGNSAKVLGSYFAPLKVQAQATPNMTVQIAAGSFWTADNEHREYAGGSSGTITAPASDAKWVLVTVTTSGTIRLRDGASGTSPDLPDPSVYENELPLAAIFVGDTTTAITNDMIYDVRPMWQIQTESITQAQLDLKADQTALDAVSGQLDDITGTTSNSFTLNSDNTPSTITQLISGGSSGPAAIRFNATYMSGSPLALTPRWEFTNDGATWLGIAGDLTAGSYYTSAEVNTLIGTRVARAGDTMSGDLDMGGNTISDVATPTLSGDAANMGYVDGEISSHTHVVADITDFPAFPVETVNGISPVAGDVTLNLTDLNNVNAPSPSTDQMIQFNGASWVAANPDLDALGDVAISGEAAGDVIIRNSGNTAFINRPLVMADISDFAASTDYVLTGVNDASPKGTAQDIYGLKTFKDGIAIEGDATLTVGDFSTTDNYLDLNVGDGADLENSNGVVGLRFDRGALSDLIFQYDSGADEWQVGPVGSASRILVAGDTLTVSDITDFGVGVTAELLNNNLDSMADVVYLGSPALSAGDFLQYNGSDWVNHVLTSADVSDFDDSTFLKTTGNQTKTGNLDIVGDFTVTGEFATSDTLITLNDGDVGDIVTNNLSVGVQVERTGTNAVLEWDDADDKWKVGLAGSTVAVELEGHTHTASEVTDFSAAADARIAAADLDDLSNVNTAGSPTLTAGDFLTFDGSNWVNDPVALNFAPLVHTHVVADITDFATGVTNQLAISDMDSFNDVTYSGLAADDFLKYDGADWVNHVLVKADVTDFTESDYLHTTGNETKTGNLTIDGAFVTTDAIIQLNDGEVGPGVTAGSGVAGISIDRGATGSPTYAPAQLLWNEGSGIWQVTVGTGTSLSVETIVTGSHTHVWTDITDTTPSLTEINYVTGVTSPIQTQIDTHTGDDTVHLTADQNTFLDALNLSGSPLLTAAEVNHLSGVTSNVQAQIDVLDSGKADKVALGSPALAGNFAGLDVNGNLTDSGSKPADFALAGHTHVSTDITNFDAAADARIAAAVLDDIGDVVLTGIADGHLIEYQSGNWVNVAGSTLFVSKSGDTVSGDLIITGDLTVSGTTTTINTQNLEVEDRTITVNSGTNNAPSADGSGIYVDRGAQGSPPVNDYAVLTWNETDKRWEGGIYGSETPFAVEAQTVAQPDYFTFTAGGSPNNASYDLGVAVPEPITGKAAIQVFVNGIKQMEDPQGAPGTKAYSVDYNAGSPAFTTINFNAGSEPVPGSDVEVYAFGYIG